MTKEEREEMLWKIDLTLEHLRDDFCEGSLYLAELYRLVRGLIEREGAQHADPHR